LPHVRQFIESGTGKRIIEQGAISQLPGSLHIYNPHLLPAFRALTSLVRDKTATIADEPDINIGVPTDSVVTIEEFFGTISETLTVEIFTFHKRTFLFWEFIRRLYS
jgi:hypothetical protein